MVKLKTSRMALAAGSLAPLVIFALVAVALLVEHERETMKRETMGRAVSALSAVDAEVRGHVTTLEALAASRNLRAGNIRAFYDEARAVLATQLAWLNIGLATTAREQLFDAVRPFGEQAPFGDDSAFHLVLRTRRQPRDRAKGRRSPVAFRSPARRPFDRRRRSRKRTGRRGPHRRGASA